MTASRHGARRISSVAFKSSRILSPSFRRASLTNSPWQKAPLHSTGDTSRKRRRWTPDGGVPLDRAVHQALVCNTTYRVLVLNQP